MERMPLPDLQEEVYPHGGMGLQEPGPVFLQLELPAEGRTATGIGAETESDDRTDEMRGEGAWL